MMGPSNRHPIELVMAYALEVKGLEKSYGDVRALKGVDLVIEEGSFFGLLGPNGAGKTTFINILVGLVERSAGEARIYGHDVEADYRVVRNLVGLSPQEYNVDRFFPIWEVLVHKAGYHGMAKPEAKERAEEVLRQVGIWEKRDVRFPWLSGGMKRRLLLARALVTRPRLLILDEPTAGVDVQLRHDLWRLVRELNAGGTTVLLTTHYLEEAEQLCDEVAILHEGRLIERASPGDLVDRGVDTVHLMLDREDGELPDFEGLPVRDTERDGPMLAIRVKGGAARSAPALLQALQQQGYEVLEMEIERSSLEDIFLEVTGLGTKEKRDE